MGVDVSRPGYTRSLCLSSRETLKYSSSRLVIICFSSTESSKEGVKVSLLLLRETEPLRKPKELDYSTLESLW